LKKRIFKMENFWPNSLLDIISIFTGLFVIVGGVMALVRYRNAVKLQGADILLRMEDEFRELLPILDDIESEYSYRVKVSPVLAKFLENQVLTNEEREIIKDIDRCLRFFYLCSVMNDDLSIDNGSLSKAYYHYMDELVSNSHPELKTYVYKYYPRLFSWIKKHIES